MDKEINSAEKEEELDPVELVLFHVSECYVYMIPPRKSAASYRADEWNVNKWSWEGTLRIISKGVECIIQLEDKKTGELYARAFLRDGDLHPVEPVIDSSRYFVLRVEENIGGRLRHAFIGLGFRERTEAYDFQAALHDHMKYLNKKKTAKEMEQQYQQTSSVDYSLKDGETLVLQLNNPKGCGSIRSKLLDQGVNKETTVLLPPPPSPVSHVPALGNPLSGFAPNFNLEECSKNEASDSETPQLKKIESHTEEDPQDIQDDYFGDFQVA